MKKSDNNVFLNVNKNNQFSQRAKNDENFDKKITTDKLYFIC